MSKRATFFHKAITIESNAFQTIATITRLQGIKDQIKLAFPNAYDSVATDYAWRLVFTTNMIFNWDVLPDLPEEYHNVESWWNMVQKGEQLEICYEYFSENIPYHILEEWDEALASLQKIYKPVREEMTQKGTDGEPIDPN